MSPSCQRLYRFMGGLDHADQLRMSYGVDRDSKKWWHRLFWGVLDIIFINAFVIYKKRHGEIPLLVFRRQVIQGLLSEKKIIAPSRAHLFQKPKYTDTSKYLKKEEENSYQFLKTLGCIIEGFKIH